ncbi:hypothetical protein CSUI_007255 [Cystoisospora suis]|uniref:Transmembrane protein n=1 Tax=Cystoisospora suis TaxID=483139 RepID=A0A2C6KQQ4_9APIC|nr:hypothetical protein CSUI_007255 [Cystoisospora suis]
MWYQALLLLLLLFLRRGHHHLPHLQSHSHLHHCSPLLSLFLLYYTRDLSWSDTHFHRLQQLDDVADLEEVHPLKKNKEEAKITEGERKRYRKRRRCFSRRCVSGTVEGVSFLVTMTDMKRRQGRERGRLERNQREAYFFHHTISFDLRMLLIEPASAERGNCGIVWRLGISPSRFQDSRRPLVLLSSCSSLCFLCIFVLRYLSLTEHSRRGESEHNICLCLISDFFFLVKRIASKRMKKETKKQKMKRIDGRGGKTEKELPFFSSGVILENKRGMTKNKASPKGNEEDFRSVERGEEENEMKGMTEEKGVDVMRSREPTSGEGVALNAESNGEEPDDEDKKRREQRRGREKEKEEEKGHSLFHDEEEYEEDKENEQGEEEEETIDGKEDEEDQLISQLSRAEHREGEQEERQEREGEEEEERRLEEILRDACDEEGMIEVMLEVAGGLRVRRSVELRSMYRSNLRGTKKKKEKNPPEEMKRMTSAGEEREEAYERERRGVRPGSSKDRLVEKNEEGEEGDTRDKEGERKERDEEEWIEVGQGMWVKRRQKPAADLFDSSSSSSPCVSRFSFGTREERERENNILDEEDEEKLIRPSRFRSKRREQGTEVMVEEENSEEDELLSKRRRRKKKKRLRRAGREEEEDSWDGHRERIEDEKNHREAEMEDRPLNEVYGSGIKMRRRSQEEKAEGLQADTPQRRGRDEDDRTDGFRRHPSEEEEDKDGVIDKHMNDRKGDEGGEEHGNEDAYSDCIRVNRSEASAGLERDEEEEEKRKKNEEVSSSSTSEWRFTKHGEDEEEELLSSTLRKGRRSRNFLSIPSSSSCGASYEEKCVSETCPKAGKSSEREQDTSEDEEISSFLRQRRRRRSPREDEEDACLLFIRKRRRDSSDSQESTGILQDDDEELLLQRRIFKKSLVSASLGEEALLRSKEDEEGVKKNTKKTHPNGIPPLTSAKSHRSVREKGSEKKMKKNTSERCSIQLLSASDLRKLLCLVPSQDFSLLGLLSSESFILYGNAASGRSGAGLERGRRRRRRATTAGTRRKTERSAARRVPIGGHEEEEEGGATGEGEDERDEERSSDEGGEKAEKKEENWERAVEGAKEVWLSSLLKPKFFYD